MTHVFRDGPRADCTLVLIAARGPFSRGGKTYLRGMLFSRTAGAARAVELSTDTGQTVTVMMPEHGKQVLKTEITLEVVHD